MMRRSQIVMRGLAGFILVLASGCSHWIELTEPATQSTTSQTTIPSDLRVPLLLETIRATQNGAPMAAPLAIERQVLGALEATHLFSQYFQSGYARPASNQAHVTIRLSMDTRVEPHAGVAAWRGLVIGASMFILAPLIPLDYDYGTQMALEVERWDGETKHYTASSSGTAHYHLFGASPHVIDELKGRVTDNCLAALLDQVIRDTAFYLADGPSQSDTPIRTVSVGARRPAIDVHPVSTNAVSPPR